VLGSGGATGSIDTPPSEPLLHQIVRQDLPSIVHRIPACAQKLAQLQPAKPGCRFSRHGEDHGDKRLVSLGYRGFLRWKDSQEKRNYCPLAHFLQHTQALQLPDGAWGAHLLNFRALSNPDRATPSRTTIFRHNPSLVWCPRTHQPLWPVVFRKFLNVGYKRQIFLAFSSWV